MTEEEAKTKWCPVLGYEGLYVVSDQGRVRSLDRWKPYRGSMRSVAGCEISPTKVSGYPRVLLWKNGHGRNAFIHRLVAVAFLGEPPTPAHQINHKNGDRADARVVNLEWVTASENLKHSYRELGRKPASNPIFGPANGRYIDGRSASRGLAGKP
jgi:hypothetical protein